MVVDADKTVQEIDETENTTVARFHPSAIPDLVVADADIQVASSFPKPGDVVPVTVSVLNSGGQAALEVPVELFLGDPDAGGSRIAQQTLARVEPNSRANAVLSWPCSRGSGTATLIAAVNRRRSVVESNYENDRALRQVAIQDGALALSYPFFSPNGDGIQDTTELFYRQATESPVTVEVQDRFGKHVRSLRSADAASASSVVWDGRSDAGAVVYDGRYVLSAFSGADVTGVPIGSIQAVVDTNQAMLEDSINTDLLVTAALGALPDPLNLLPDDSGAVLQVSRWTGSTYKCSIDLAPIPFGAPMRVFGLDETDCSCSYGAASCRTRDPVAISPDGRYLAISIEDYSNYRLSKRTLAELSLTDASLKSLADTTNESWSVIGYLPDGAELVIATPQGIIALNRQTMKKRDIVSMLGSYYALSPDGKAIGVLTNDGALYLIDTSTGEPKKLIEPGVIPVDYGYSKWYYYDGGVYRNLRGKYSYVAWIPNSNEIAYIGVAANHSIDSPSICGQRSCTGYYYGVRPCSAPCGWIEAPGLYAVNVSTGARRLLFEVPESKFDYLDAVSASPSGNALAFSYLKASLNEMETGQLWVMSPIGSEPMEVEGAKRQIRGVSWSAGGNIIISQGLELALTSLANMALQVSAFRKYGEEAVTFSGTAQDINFDYYELLVRPHDGQGAPVVVARYLKPASNTVLAKWTPPTPGVFDVTLVGHDKAGNVGSTTTVMSWTDQPDFSDLRADQQHISPNGDGVQDSVTFTYAVNNPRTARFQVSNLASGRMVRSFERANTESGRDSFGWDGRDESGDLAADGTYRLQGEGMSIDLIVDNTLPDVELYLGSGSVRNAQVAPPSRQYFYPGFGLAFTKDGQRTGVPTFQARSFVREVADLNLAEWRVEKRDASPAMTVTQGRNSVSLVPEAVGLYSAYRRLDSWYDLGYSGGASVTNGQPVVSWSSLEALRGSQMRLRATDRAGNERVSNWIAAPELLFITGIGAPEALVPLDGSGDYLVLQGRRVPRIDRLMSVGDKELQRQRLIPGQVVFSLSTTVNEEIRSYSLSYRALGASEWIQDIDRVSILDELVIVWDARHVNLDAGRCLEVKVQATDARGRLFEDVQRICAGQEMFEISSMCVSPFTSGLTMTFQTDPREPRCIDKASIHFLPVGSTTSEMISNVEPACSWASVDTRGLKQCRYSVVVDGIDEYGKPLHAESGVNLCRMSAESARYVSGRVVLEGVAQNYRAPLSSIDILGSPDGVVSIPGFNGTLAAVSIPFSERACGTFGFTVVPHTADGSGGADAAIGLSDSACRPVVVDGPCMRMQVSGTAAAITPLPLCGGYLPTYAVTAAATQPVGGNIRSMQINVVGSGAQAFVKIPLVLTNVVSASGGMTAEASLDTNMLADGRYRLRVEANDDLGQAGAADIQEIVVDRSGGLATVSSPSAGQVVCARMEGRDALGKAKMSFNVEGVVGGENVDAFEVGYGAPGQLRVLKGFPSVFPGAGTSAVSKKIDSSARL